MQILSRLNDFCRPHTKYDGRLCVHRCLSVNEDGGYPLVSDPWSLVSGPFLGGVPLVSGSWSFPREGIPSQACGQGSTPRTGFIPLDMWVPPLAGTGYATGDTPLVVTQEDFLVTFVDSSTDLNSFQIVNSKIK